MNRRSVLTAGAATLGVALGVRRRIVPARNRRTRGPARGDVEADTIMEGTQWETPVYTVQGTESGPTGVVVGGMHGDEPNGYRAAEAIAEWQLDEGTLVVVPRANAPAIERGTREGPEGDLNRKFPTGEDPTTELAGAIWDVVRERDPAVVVDLHRSRGIYGTHDKWVGQAIFPTAVDGAVSDARTVIEETNEGTVPWTMRFHRFALGPPLDGGSPLLIHKVAGDLDRPGFLVELTEFLLDLDTQVRWTKRITERLLERNGIRRSG